MARPNLFVSTAALALILSIGLALIIARPNAKRTRVLHKSTRMFLTFRISNIPRDVTGDQIRDILSSTASGIAHQPNLLGWSFTPAVVPGLAERFWVATATFRVPPALSELEMAIKRKIGEEASRLTVDEDFFGLTPLADPPKIQPWSASFPGLQKGCEELTISLALLR
jgi:hypothetical protein